jgi:hypothetical protein
MNSFRIQGDPKVDSRSTIPIEAVKYVDKTGEEGVKFELNCAVFYDVRFLEHCKDGSRRQGQPVYSHHNSQCREV